MAALRAGLHTVILPAENEKDLDDIDQSVRRQLRFVTVETVDAVFAEALVLPETLSGKGIDAFLEQAESVLTPALRV
jgi:ATP-dependent Lon protease